MQNANFLPLAEPILKNSYKYEMQYWFPTEKFHDNINLMLTKVDFTIYIQKLKQIIIIIVLLKKKVLTMMHTWSLQLNACFYIYRVNGRSSHDRNSPTRPFVHLSIL